MRFDWLEDILAVLDTGSLRAAAERRCVTQPAFSRRIRAIEAELGVELFDRTRKPMALSPGFNAHENDFRRTALQLRQMMGELRRSGGESHGRVVIASQHALTATLAPELVANLFCHLDLLVRLRTANREECLARLMARQADVMIGYQTEAEAAAGAGEFVDRAELGHDALIPVFAGERRRELREALDRGELPVIAYPREAFLGQVMAAEIEPRLASGLRVHTRVETALTLAAMEFARKGLGVAWLPESVARPALANGALHDLRDILPAASLRIVALRLRVSHGESEERLWAVLSQAGLQAAPA